MDCAQRLEIQVPAIRFLNYCVLSHFMVYRNKNTHYDVYYKGMFNSAFNYNLIIFCDFYSIIENKDGEKILGLPNIYRL